MEIIMKLLTHNDLDGYGCRFILEDKYNFESVIHTSYDDCSDNLKAIKNTKTDDKTLFVTDLNFKKDDLKNMIELLKDGWKIRYFDHHKYEEKRLKLFEKLKEKFNFKYIIDTSISATKILGNIFNPQNENLQKLIDIIDTYDMWRLESPLWNKAFAINNIFYLVGENNFYKKVKENNYIIPEEFKKNYKEYLKRKDEYFKKMEEDGRITIVGDIALFIMDSYDFSSFVQFDYPDYKHYIIVYPFAKRFSLRHKNIDDKEMENKFKKLMEITHPSIKSLGGHLYAQGIVLHEDATIEDIQEVIELIGGILYEE
jgi:oligoribonuclease NrnB/cAMP/cGMP phosphodiesterase (DHH superfamily)